MTNIDTTDTPPKIQEPRLWQDDGWTARVIKNEDDEGWAVEMRMDGQAEPALVAPWTMGRDKKNPKPLDPPSFYTWVKTASEVVRRHEQQLHATLHKSTQVRVDGATLQITLDITPDDDEPFGTLSACDTSGVPLAQVRVEASYKLTDHSALAWVQNQFRRPGGREE